MEKGNILILVLTLSLAFYIGTLTFLYRVMNAHGIKAAKYKKENIPRIAVNFAQEAFISLKPFEMPMFYAYKMAGYSVSKIHLAKFSWQHYSLFYFKNKSNLVGGMANFNAAEVFCTGDPKPINDITYYGGEQLKALSTTAAKEAFSGKEVFVELSSAGSLFGFKPAAISKIQLKEMYIICEKILNEIKRTANAT